MQIKTHGKEVRICLPVIVRNNASNFDWNCERISYSQSSLRFHDCHTVIKVQKTCRCRTMLRLTDLVRMQ